MTKILVIAEHSGGALRKHVLAVTAFAGQIAQKTGGSYDFAVVGHDVGALAGQIANYGGGKVYVIDAPHLETYYAQSYSQAIADIVGHAGSTIVMSAASAFGKDCLPRVAVKLGAGMASDVVGLGGGDLTYLRPMWAGNVMGEVEITTPVHVVSVRTAEFDAAAAGPASSPVESVASTFDHATLKQKLVEFRPTVSARPDLAEAGVVIAGGRGVKSKDNFGLVEELADLLGGAVGATRAAVDAEYIENEYQIGQTGKIIAPDLYIGMGISGAIQHLAGMKNSKVIVAINKDEEAPIFSVADYGLVADLFKVVPDLIQKVKGLKS